MNDIMISVENVSMRFNLGVEKGFSLKQGFVDFFSPQKRKERNARQEAGKDFWALKEVSFDIHQGEVIGLVGTNGAGKSTMLKIVSGVYKPTSGNVKVYGNICPMIELGAGFDMDLTATENVFLNGSIMGYSKDFLESKFQDIVDFSELHDFMNVPVRNFSSGMMARLAFSIATVVDPEILIVDEILSVGDAAFQAKSEGKMLSMIHGGTTVLYVSHSIESICRLCNRVIWLDHGTVRMIGETNDVCRAYCESLGIAFPEVHKDAEH